MQEQEKITTLPGVFATIAAGFDLTAKHLWLLVLPVCLDVLYWLGPRLRFQNLIKQLLDIIPEEADLLDLGGQLAQAAPRTNLFTTLSVQFIGVPALMIGQVPEETPIATQAVDIDSWLSWLGFLALFSIIGILLTAIFYTLIAYAISKQTPDSKLLSSGQWAKRVGSNWLRLIGLVFLFLLIVFIIYIPLIIISTILFMINGVLGSIVLLAGPLILIWITIFLFLAPFGIVLNNRPVLKAAFESMRLVQVNLPSVLFLLLTVLFTGILLDWLLFAVENGTWLTLVNILGHAFVSTALIAAIFIYYHDRYIALFDPEAVLLINPPSNNNQ